MGKLSSDELQKLLSCIPKDSRVMVPPTVGYDFGVHVIDDKYLVVATDPCIGVPEDWFGWLLINYAASDVALSGAKPEFCAITLLSPKSTQPEFFRKIMRQTCAAAEELGIAIVRGHTGMYDSLKDVVGIATVYGQIKPEKLITVAGAKPGDLIFCTKPLGLETLINFALTHKTLAQTLFGAQRQQALAGQVRLQSCVEEALALAASGGVNAMHDATEGGFVAALNELADASGVGFRVDWKKIPITAEVQMLKAQFGLSDEQVLSLSSTGTILGAARPEAKEKVKAVLSEKGLAASFLGEFTENKEKILFKNGGATVFPNVPLDPYDLILYGT